MESKTQNIYCFDTYFQDDKRIRDKTVYHYTSPEALVSILTNALIRFTDCQFMNDRSEYNHILQPLETAVHQAGSDLHNKNIFKNLQNLLGTDFQTFKFEAHKSSDGHLSFNMKSCRYFLFCASIVQDSLNMWNYYVKNGSYQGYNVGFSTLDIVKNIKSSLVDSILFGRVIYDSKTKNDLLAKLLVKYDQSLYNANQENQGSETLEEALFDIQQELLDDLNLCRLFFKDSAFEGEKEFRIVILLPRTDCPDSDDCIKRGFTSKHGIITPHIDVKIPKTSIKRITLSPMLESELAIEGLNRLLQNHNYDSQIEISTSAIPLRF